MGGLRSRKLNLNNVLFERFNSGESDMLKDSLGILSDYFDGASVSVICEENDRCFLLESTEHNIDRLGNINRQVPIFKFRTDKVICNEYRSLSKRTKIFTLLSNKVEGALLVESDSYIKELSSSELSLMALIVRHKRLMDLANVSGIIDKVSMIKNRDGLLEGLSNKDLTGSYIACITLKNRTELLNSKVNENALIVRARNILVHTHLKHIYKIAINKFAIVFYKTEKDDVVDALDNVLESLTDIDGTIWSITYASIDDIYYSLFLVESNVALDNELMFIRGGSNDEVVDFVRESADFFQESDTYNFKTSKKAKDVEEEEVIFDESIYRDVSEAEEEEDNDFSDLYDLFNVDDLNDEED